MDSKSGAVIANRKYLWVLLFALVSWGIDTYGGSGASETHQPIGWTVVPILAIPIAVGLFRGGATLVRMGRVLLWIMFPIGVFLLLPPGLDVSASTPQWSWVSAATGLVALSTAFLLALNLLRSQNVTETRVDGL